jgi:ligand-binding SRPBCC domain-containing protein
MAVVESSFLVRAPLKAVWEFHNDPRALPKIMPDLFGLAIEEYDQPMRAGSRVRLSMGAGPLRRRWVLQVIAHEPPRQFVDEQLPGQGPFKRWRHTHRFEPAKDGTLILDRIEYELPFGVLGKIAAGIGGPLMMRLIFASRQTATRKALEPAAHAGPATGVSV